ncbi:hypothetical protein AE1304_40670 [Aeromonas enteropelogenes]
MPPTAMAALVWGIVDNGKRAITIGLAGHSVCAGERVKERDNRYLLKGGGPSPHRPARVTSGLVPW